MRASTAITLALFAFAAASPARADDACKAFSWPLEREQAWLSDPKLPVVESGGAAKSGGAFVVKLAPMGQVKFAMTPERTPKNADSFGGFVTIGQWASAGLVQITLSDEVWIDVIQSDSRMKSAAFSGKQGCSGMRKSVRFDLAAAPFAIQISGAPADHVSVAVAPVR